jgi:hypothetical protein
LAVCVHFLLNLLTGAVDMRVAHFPLPLPIRLTQGAGALSPRRRPQLDFMGHINCDW